MTFFQWLDTLGLVVFAVTGALAAGRKRLDPFGVLVVALITALGGGTLRDLVLNAHPVAWIAKPDYLMITSAAAFGTLLLARWIVFPARALDVFDAVGLAFFTLLGTQKTLTLGHPAEVALMMGVMTGVAGGVLRDIICNEIPHIFRQEIYATAAAMGAGIYLFLRSVMVSESTALQAGMAVTLVVRLLAIYRDWSLPTPGWREHDKR